jgi:hypothetical protein
MQLVEANAEFGVRAHATLSIARSDKEARCAAKFLLVVCVGTGVVEIFVNTVAMSAPFV